MTLKQEESKPMKCNVCNGSGTISSCMSDDMDECSQCNGTGVITTVKKTQPSLTTVYEYQYEFLASLEALQKEIHETAKSKGFYETPPTPLERICLMHEELSEAASAHRHNNPPDDKIPEFTGLEAELADCIIRILDFAEYKGLRVGLAILAKMVYNKTRPYKHGKNS